MNDITLQRGRLKKLSTPAQNSRIFFESGCKSSFRDQSPVMRHPTNQNQQVPGLLPLDPLRRVPTQQDCCSKQHQSWNMP
ncbi:hypothetical protein SynMITS9220_01851 [Synechococcus sp. MIT S9220]|nr:hypothetical protein SynMITS9220_01851 [Synechococcus sp. MIT S9220]